MSNGASFVKRSKPRSSASRISSTYDDINDEPGPSTSTLRTASKSTSTVNWDEQNGDTASTARPSLSAPDADGDGTGEPSSSSVVFRARARGTKGTSASTSASSSKIVASNTSTPLKKERSAFTAMEDERDQEDGSDPFEIRRSKLSVAGKEARRSAAGLSTLSSSSIATPKRSTPLRPTSFQEQPPVVETKPSSHSGSNMYTSKYLDELRSSTPTVRSRGHSPAPAPTGPGTRIDDPILAHGSGIALDGTEGDQLARAKFPADFSYADIPSESVIRAAKEKRAKLRAAAVSTDASSDDYISLAPFGRASVSMEMDDGPHPHSRLQREEDELGDGEEEFADYTGATERIPIGEKAEKEWKEQQRKQMEAAVRGDFDQDALLPGNTVVEEMDEDEEEWERAQLRRTQLFPSTSADAHSREPSPYRAAPIPSATPLPSVSTCSTRLALTLRALEQSTAASAAVISSTSKELDGLEAAERENQLDVATMEAKASWFNELDEFVGSLARFIEEKMPQVEELEKEAVDLLARRTSMIGKKRARWFEKRLEQCLSGKPTLSIVPDGEEQEDQGTDTVEESIIEESLDVRQLETLNAADELSYTQAQREIPSKLKAVFRDVQAAEYLNPVATRWSSWTALPPHTPRERSDLHPRSVVSRFEEWRRLYADEYAQVWGGLSVAQIWEFYARLELMSWDVFDPLRGGSDGGWSGGADAIGHFDWFGGASDYVERAVGGGEAIGGDDEVLCSLVSNVLVDKLITLAKTGGFDPWSETHTLEAVQAVDVVQTVVGAHHTRCISLIHAYLDVFTAQINRLHLIFTQPIAPTSTAVAEALNQVLDLMVTSLLSNLTRWSKVVNLAPSAAGPVMSQGQRLVQLVQTLVTDVFEPLLVHLASLDPPTATHIRSAILHILPTPILAHSDPLTSFTQHTL